MSTRQWEYVEANRKEFEGAHELVVKRSRHVTWADDLKELARAWGAADEAYAEAYRTFFQAAQASIRRSGQSPPAASKTSS